MSEFRRSVKMASPAKFPSKGVYTLLISLKKDVRRRVGKLGIMRFEKGIYFYTGSALGNGSTGLMGRISRHLRLKKRVWWHIDYFLRSPQAFISYVVFSKAEKRVECEVHKVLYGQLNGARMVRGFGSSDCKKGCVGHLLYVGELDKAKALKAALKAYAIAGLKPKVLKRRGLEG